MARVTLTRIVKPVVIVSDHGACIKDEVKTLAITFTGDDDKTVSLAFDGRVNRSAIDARILQEDYSVLVDNPVRAGARYMAPGTDLQTMQFLRDALIAMDLGAYDGRATCIECGKKYERDGDAYGSFCPDCMATDYCVECGKYAILNDKCLCADCDE